MTELYIFCNDNPWLAWSALWLVWGPIWIVGATVESFMKLGNRILRSINIAIRGWPPEHLDADGDFLCAEKEGIDSELPEEEEKLQCYYCSVDLSPYYYHLKDGGDVNKACERCANNATRRKQSLST